MMELSRHPTTGYQAVVSQLKPGNHSSSETLLAVLRPASQEVAAALACAEGDSIIHLRILQRVNGVAVSLINHYLRELSWWPALQQFSADSSLHDVIHTHTGARLICVQTRVSTRRAQAKECRMLEVALQSPLLCMRTLHTHADGEIAEYTVSLTRGNMMELTLEH